MRCLLAAGLSMASLLSGCTDPEVAALPRIQPLPGVTVAFDSFVNVNYGKGRSLPGWQTTRAAIEAALKTWYEQVDVRQSVTDGTPADLRRFLQSLPGPAECDISVVYLGSIQNAAAEWLFVDGPSVSWHRLLEDAGIPSHPCRIVVLDSCHAAAVRGVPAWNNGFVTVGLLASGPDERTYQMEPSVLRPIDVRKHYPAAWSWAKLHLQPTWRHVSFLGLMWIEAAAQTPSPPANEADWTAFFKTCQHNAETFRRTISPRWGSAVQPF